MTQTTKIKATEIKKGMKIKVSSIYDTKEDFQNTLDSNITWVVCKGAIKKDSPVLNIKEVDFCTAHHSEGQRGTVTINVLTLITDKGIFKISTRQKVELIN